MAAKSSYSIYSSIVAATSTTVLSAIVCEALVISATIPAACIGMLFA
ncbi:hypothetical protein [Anaeromicropila populeti]|nr:hypothetical protein [Anaeromicropila populeti]